jgi:hypothetical protein
MLNLTEWTWTGLKNSVRDENVSCSLHDVQHLTYQWMMSLSRTTSMSYIDQTCKIETVLKKSDQFIAV